ncbi:hypothetical protein [Streptomyces sp. NPDC047014]|uniref:hypothetical protein n=1 Tax=Streptomyces sp. NPDC047014 TaxID=3155736 RepID=UPI0033CBA854
MTAHSPGVPGEVMRGGSGTTELVLRAGGGSWLTLPRSLGDTALAALVAGVLGLVLLVPVAVVLLFTGAGWPVVGVVALWMVSVAAAAGFVGALAGACFQVYRIGFAAPGDPSGVRLVRGLGAGPWRPAREEPYRLRLEQEIVEPYAGDPRPATRVLTLRLIREDADVCRAVLPPDTDAGQLLASLEQAVDPAVLLESHIRRTTRPEPRIRPRGRTGSGFGISGAGGSSCGGSSGCGGGGGGG